MSLGLPQGPGRITAVLGPTNTGKTHLAVERMLGHSSGIIGLPLRLLAREIYDRIAALKGRNLVALVTGEEKIIPPHAQYFICTVEAMPLDRSFNFLCVDEIQLIADPDRGHVFTDRLLHTRGQSETMFLGSDAAMSVIRRLVPEAEFITRPRLSNLSYAGAKKLSRLPKRAAIVAFSAQDVYAIAELVRRQKGGAAVVLGALSPRTRNAQVAMFQAREVDYLIATDAIGMGLNMAIEHVAFAQTRKFDGAIWRDLTAAEIGQIAGRAGRHLNDGTFGITAETEALSSETVERVENHRFDPIRKVRWRNAALDFSSPVALVRSLEISPPLDCLSRARDADDYLALRALLGHSDIARLANNNRGNLRLLWEICQIPDFRKTSQDQHHRLLTKIFGYLSNGDQRLPKDWVAAQVAAQDRADGDIDTLAQRIAHIRTWTYISHRADWLNDASLWQDRARAIEDKLSDALHERLTQRFVDRRTAVLLSRLKDRQALTAIISDKGDVIVEGQFIGRLVGLDFQIDANVSGTDGRALRAAANRSLHTALHNRTGDLIRSAETDFSLSSDGMLLWREEPVARLIAGDHVMRPKLRLIGGDQLDGQRRLQTLNRLEVWLKTEIQRRLKSIILLETAELSAPGRGLAFLLAEHLGKLPRILAAHLIRQISHQDRKQFTDLGLHFGFTALYIPALLKPAAIQLCGILWSVSHNLTVPELPPSGRVSFPAPSNLPDGFLTTMGFRVFGKTAIRLDILERIAVKASLAGRQAPFILSPEMLSLAGCDRKALGQILKGLGYKEQSTSTLEGNLSKETALLFSPPTPRRRKIQKDKKQREQAKHSYDPYSPFAKLKSLLPAE